MLAIRTRADPCLHLFLVDYDDLFERFYPSLHRYCIRLTGDGDVADDVAQESFVRMVRGEVTGDPKALKVWLFRTALNLVRDRSRIRSNRRRLLEENPDAASGPGEPDLPDRELLRARRIGRVRHVLRSLDERDRTLLVMREEGFKYEEMANAVDVATNSVGTLLARAEKRFARAYREFGFEDDVASNRG